MKLFPRLPNFARLLLALAVFPIASALASGSGFTASLTPENRAAAGLDRLSAAQVAALDIQVAQEVATAKSGRTVAFSTSFTHRRSPQQRKDAGLDQLMTPELTRLDTLVAAAVAASSQPAGATTAASPASKPLSSMSSDWIETTPDRLKVHGEVGFSYSWTNDGGHGYDSWGVTSVTDPSEKMTLTVGIGQGEYKDKHPYRYYGPYPSIYPYPY